MRDKGESNSERRAKSREREQKMTQEEEWKGKAGETRGKGSQMYRERQKLNKFNWRPCFKQRGLFSDRDPSPEIELEKRLIEAVRVAQLVPQQTWRSVSPNNVHDAALQSIHVPTLIGLRQRLVCLQTFF